MTRHDYDLLIVGGGPGGYVSALYAARNGLSVALIEKDASLGGACINRGCIPTKALLHSAALWKSLRESARWGVSAAGASCDFAQIMKNKERIVSGLTGNVKSLLQANRIAVLRGRGVVEAAHRATVHGGRDKRSVTARHIIIATGSEPSRLSIPGADLPGVVDSDQALAFDAVPGALTIIGGGVVGLEIGWFYAALGSRVTIVEALPRLVDRHDVMISEGLERALRKDGVTALTSTRVERIEKTASGLCTRVSGGGGEVELNSDKVLVAVGRRPVLDVASDLPLEKEKGFVRVDDRLQTGVEDIYAVGDVTGRALLAHVAFHQGMVAVDNILGLNSRMRYDAVPACIHTRPGAAGVGMTEHEARERHGEALCGIFPFAASGMAHCAGDTAGAVKIVAEPRRRRVVGAHILGPGATESIAELALAVEMECTAEELARTVHAHPSLSEASMEACLDLMGTPLHKL